MTRRKISVRKVAILTVMGLVGGGVGAVIDATKDLIPGIIWKNPNKGSIYAFVFIGTVAALLLTYIWLNDTDKTDTK